MRYEALKYDQTSVRNAQAETRSPYHASKGSRRMNRAIFSAFILFLTTLLAATGACASARSKRDALWKIVADRCVPDELTHGDPAPCRLVDLAHGRKRGWALLKDRRGLAQFLLIPTTRITGIEDPRLFAAGAPDYWRAAWNARAAAAALAHLSLDSIRIGLAVNSAVARSQDQLHIHIDCIRPATIAALQTVPASSRWAPVVITGRAYATRTVATDSLHGVHIFAMVAARARKLGVPMARETVALVSTRNSKGRLFHVLVATVHPSKPFGAEELLDHTCGAKLP